MDFFLLVTAAVGLVWGIILLRAGGLLAGSLLVLLSGICFGHPFFNVSLGPLPVTFDRLLLAGLLAMALVYRRFGWADPKPLAKADWTLLAFAAVLLLTTFLHDWRDRASQPLANLLFLYLAPLVLYWIVRQAAVSERMIWGMFLALALFGVYLSATAIAETHQMWALVVPKYIASPSHVEFFGRGRGPLLNPAGSGILQGLCLVAAVVSWPHLRLLGRVLLLAALPLFAWGIYSTLTRSAWMGAGLGALVIVALTLPRAWRVAVLGTLALVALPFAASSWDSLLAFKRDKSLCAEEAAESAKLRPILAVVAWHMFLDRPLLGCGFGQYTAECRPYLSDRSTDLPLEKSRPYVQHNVFLALLAETGLLGAGLFTATLILWVRAAFRLWNAAAAPVAFRRAGLLFLGLIGVWLPNAMFQDVSLIPMINMLLLAMAGLTMNLSLAADRALSAGAREAVPVLPRAAGGRESLSGAALTPA